MDWLALLTTWLEIWRAHGVVGHLVNVLAGAMGACLYVVVTANRVVIPVYDRKRKRLELGFVGYLAGGIVCGFVVDHSAPLAVMAGAVLPPILRLMFNKILPVAARVALRRIADGIDDIADRLEQSVLDGKVDDGKGREGGAEAEHDSKRV